MCSRVNGLAGDSKLQIAVNNFENNTEECDDYHFKNDHERL